MGIWGRSPTSQGFHSICKWMKPIFWLGCYGCIFHGTGNSAQLCRNFGISGVGVWNPNPPPFGTPLVYMNLFTWNSPYYHLLKYLLFLRKHPVHMRVRVCVCVCVCVCGAWKGDKLSETTWLNMYYLHFELRNLVRVLWKQTFKHYITFLCSNYLTGWRCEVMYACEVQYRRNQRRCVCMHIITIYRNMSDLTSCTTDHGMDGPGIESRWGAIFSELV
jgi:hypothetical protein